MTTLEDRYRRLLAFYPRWHRDLYEEEMVGVLMAGADPDRSRPSLRDLADIVASAAAVHLRRTGEALAGEAWRRAAYVVLLAGTLLLAAVAQRRLVVALIVDRGHHAGVPIPVTAVDVLRPALWTLAALLALVRVRRVAVALAVASAAGEVVRVGSWYATSPTAMLRDGWLVAVAVVVAAAAGWLGRRAAWPHRPRAGVSALGLAAFVVLASGPVEVAGGGWADAGLPFVSSPGGGPVLPNQSSAALCWVTTGVLLFWAWARQDPAVRMRLLAFAAPIAAVLALIPVGFAGYLYSSSQFTSPIPLAGVQWVLLLTVPLLAFATGVVVVHRRERVQHLVRLGRAAERTGS